MTSPFASTTTIGSTLRPPTAAPVSPPDRWSADQKHRYTQGHHDGDDPTAAHLTTCDCSTITLCSCCVPITGALVGLLTIAVLYTLTVSSLPAGVVTPPISLLGCASPAHEVYQVGFASTGLLLGYSLTYLRQYFYPSMRQCSRMGAMASWWGGILAMLGVVGQGVVTLHPDFLQNIKQKIMTPQDKLHQQLALVFFVGAAMHTYSTSWYSYYYHQKDQALLMFSNNSRRIKMICVLVSILSWPIAEYFHPTRYYSASNKRVVNVIGLAQYLAVGSYIVFFGSYSIDLYNLRQRKASVLLSSSSLSSTMDVPSVDDVTEVSTTSTATAGTTATDDNSEHHEKRE